MEHIPEMKEERYFAVVVNDGLEGRIAVIPDLGKVMLPSDKNKSDEQIIRSAQAALSVVIRCVEEVHGEIDGETMHIEEILESPLGQGDNLVIQYVRLLTKEELLAEEYEMWSKEKRIWPFG